MQLRSTCIVKEQARPEGGHRPEGGAREPGEALCLAGAGGLAGSHWECGAGLLSLVFRAAQGQENSRTVCSDLCCGWLLSVTPAQIFKGKFTLVCNLNSLGPIRLHGCCISSRLTACSPDPGVAENGKRTTAERDEGKRAISSLDTCFYVI